MKKHYLILLLLILSTQQELQCMNKSHTISTLFLAADEINSNMAMLFLAANKLNAEPIISTNNLSSPLLAPQNKKGKKRSRKKISENKTNPKKKCVRKKPSKQLPVPTVVEKETIAYGSIPSQIQDNKENVNFTINLTYTHKYNGSQNKNSSEPMTNQLSSAELIKTLTTKAKVMKTPLLIDFLFEPISSTSCCLLQQAINAEKIAEFKLMLFVAAQKIASLKTALVKIKHYHTLEKKLCDAIIPSTIQNNFTSLVNSIIDVISNTSKKNNSYLCSKTDEKGRNRYIKTVETTLKNLLTHDDSISSKNSYTMPLIESLGATEEA